MDGALTAFGPQRGSVPKKAIEIQNLFVLTHWTQNQEFSHE
jgi:hypothetical protein